MKITFETTSKEVEIVQVILSRLVNDLKGRSDALAKWELNQVDLGRIERFRDALRGASLEE